METETGSTPEEAVDNRFNVVRFELKCPFNEHRLIPIEMGWVNREFPTLHLNAPEMVRHLAIHDLENKCVSLQVGTPAYLEQLKLKTTN